MFRMQTKITQHTKYEEKKNSGPFSNEKTISIRQPQCDLDVRIIKYGL